MAKILVVEDEMAISRVLQAYLKKAGYDVIVAMDGAQALDMFDEQTLDLVLLDVMLPKHSGWEILQYIREQGDCPVIMLTALADVDDKLRGLKTGADDYIAKPFNGDEVIARVEAVLRRSKRTTEDVLTFGQLTINQTATTVMVGKEPIHLTPRDYSVLLFLASHPNMTFTREQLLDRIWGMDYDGSDRAVDLAVKRIRQALAAWPTEQGEIRTLRGLGYQLRVND